MKRFHWALVAMAVAGTSIGCNESAPGGPGVSNPPPSSGTPTTVTANRPEITTSEETFKVSMPLLATHLKQGETKSVSVGLSRGKNFDEDVTLKFDNIPKGLTISPEVVMIKHGDSQVEMTLQAADDAAIGDFTIKVTGHPTKGADAKADFKVAVAAK